MAAVRAAFVACAALVLSVAFAAVADAAAQPADVGVIVNARDPLSRFIGEEYVTQRGIPPGNRVIVEFDPARDALSRGEFERLHADILRQTPASVQFYAITWQRPFRVECMSITSAMAFGYDPAFCSAGCGRTRLSAYFGSDSRRPWDELRMRPTMAIAAATHADARALIRRGLAADGTRPQGTAYLVTTGDAARDVRAAGYAMARDLLHSRLDVRLEQTRGLTGRKDVMFYFIGAADVPSLETNRFRPGAIADHLTSSGGVLVGGAQMSSMRWLEAGATGSFGTVVEPCNLVGKFPSPAIAMQKYVAGDTLIEAYWKSVAMPGQGIFIGEPLARPFAAAIARGPARP